VPTFKVSKIESKEESWENFLARFCYHYQQYTFDQARKMPKKRVVQMLRVAQSEYSRQMLDMLNVVTAPHTDKGKGVKKMVDYFKNKILE
jgi:hypothetical protein